MRKVEATILKQEGKKEKNMLCRNMKAIIAMLASQKLTTAAVSVNT